MISPAFYKNPCHTGNSHTSLQLLSISPMATATMTTNPPVTDNDNDNDTNAITAVTPDTTKEEAAAVEKSDVTFIEPNDGIQDITQRGETVTALAANCVVSSLQPHYSGKLYILSLIQMYQDIYQQFITRFYKDMIWNMTKARRVMQSRSTTTSSTTLLSVVHIPYHRTFSAQRRMFDSTASTASTATVRHSNVLSECDPQGRSIHHAPPPPLTNEDDDQNDPTEEWLSDHNNNNNNSSLHQSGLRQRRGRLNQPTSRLMNEEVVSPIESSHATKTETTENDDDMMISLLLLSSGTGTTSDLIQSQTKSRQLLQYLTTIQTQLVQQLQQEINTNAMKLKK